MMFRTESVRLLWCQKKSGIGDRDFGLDWRHKCRKRLRISLTSDLPAVRIRGLHTGNQVSQLSGGFEVTFRYVLNLRQ
jgi:hypothetical protein